MTRKILFDGESWDFSQYFDYIESARKKMPPRLREFACSTKSYLMSGSETLHDGRVISLSINKKYDLSYSDAKTGIKIEIIDQYFEGVHLLEYEMVSEFCIREKTTGVAHADILVHEFRVLNEESFEHTITIDHDAEIKIKFLDFTHSWNRLQE